jgi:hypothetical protein
VLAIFDANYGSITELVPDRHDFVEGEESNNIGDGGDDMFDGGNYLATNLHEDIDYSNNVIVESDDIFGPGSRYFTKKY